MIVEFCIYEQNECRIGTRFLIINSIGLLADFDCAMDVDAVDCG